MEWAARGGQTEGASIPHVAQGGYGHDGHVAPHETRYSSYLNARPYNLGSTSWISTTNTYSRVLIRVDHNTLMEWTLFNARRYYLSQCLVTTIIIRSR